MACCGAKLLGSTWLLRALSWTFSHHDLFAPGLIRGFLTFENNTVCFPGDDSVPLLAVGFLLLNFFMSVAAIYLKSVNIFEGGCRCSLPDLFSSS